MRNENILQVAIQCPSSGGPSVHIARIFISMVNDTMEYNDKDVCATLGIFRIANPSGIAKSTPQLICFPNPASTSLQMLFNGLSGSEFTLELHDVTGKLISHKKFTSNTGIYYLNTAFLLDGLFHIIVSDVSAKYVNTKFIIIR